jgi:hypothetical protein
VAERKLTISEIHILHQALSADYKTSNIRLREGEYQYTLAKAIASLQLELHLPDVRGIIKTQYGEEKTNDIQFIRKIQTILKKMEKSNIVKILPKKKPWDLQRYALTSFKFQDADKNFVVFATEDQINQAQDMLRSISNEQEVPVVKPDMLKTFALVLMVIASYAMSVWALIQTIVNPIIFIITFSIAVVCSVMLGKALSHG